MHFSFIKTLMKQVILFLFKEMSVGSLGSIMSPGVSHTSRHKPRFRSHTQGRWAAPLFAGGCSKASLDPSRL